MHISNKKAHYEYFILEEYTAGIKLVGSEVKALRESNGNITDAYVFIQNNEIFIKGMYIAKYQESSYMNHEEVHDRKLLLNKKEIRDLQKELKVNGVTIIPLYVFLMNGKIKVKIGLAKGKNTKSKKETIKEKDIKRQTQRELNGE